MIHIEELTLKNFLSVGQVTQVIRFDHIDMTLILGKNLDASADSSGARNGTGKTTIIQGLCYALFGEPLAKIKQDNLINNINEKQMMVTVKFSVKGVQYQIIRGRKPNVLKFFVNGTEQQDNESQGNSLKTQEVIEKTLCMNLTMFRQIVALSTKNIPFLDMPAANQREVIESLLGITLLSEKADALRKLNTTVKAEVQREQFRISGLEEANKRIINQIDSLKARQIAWKEKYDADLLKLVTEYDKLTEIDIQKELDSHKQLAVYNATATRMAQRNAIVVRQQAWKSAQENSIKALKDNLAKLSRVNIEAELSAHIELARYNENVKNQNEQTRKLKQFKIDFDREQKRVPILEKEIESLKLHKCHACGQDFHDAKHEEVLKQKEADLEKIVADLSTLDQLISSEMSNLISVGDKPITFYPNEAAAIRHSSEVDSLLAQLKAKNDEVDPYAEQLADMAEEVLGEKPVTHYPTEDDAIKHNNRVALLMSQMTQKAEETDPYTDQIAEMQSNALQAVDTSELTRLSLLLEHQEYLLDLLTNKKSFVRKKIIDQNLSHLNNRLSYYLDKYNMLHSVAFQNDLTVEISKLGRDLDYGNLSNGEQIRLNMSLSMAFRDVWESLYMPVNVLFVDELLDNGLDPVGSEASISLLKDLVRSRKKGVWIITHKEEMMNRVDTVLTVTMENGFTRYGDE